MQGIAERNVCDEIAPPALLQHPRHRTTCNVANARLELSEIGRHEPALRQRPVFRMVGGVHLHQRAHQVRAASDLADTLFDPPRRQRGRAVGIVEQLVLAADGLDMRVFCHHPERIEVLRPRHAEWVVGAEPAIAVMNATIGIGGRVDEGGRNVGWNVDIPVQGGRRIHGSSPPAFAHDLSRRERR